MIKLKELSRSKFQYICINLILMLPFVYVLFTTLFHPYSEDPVALLTKSQKVYYASDSTDRDPMQYYKAIKMSLIDIRDLQLNDEVSFLTYFSNLYKQDKSVNCGLFYNSISNTTTIYSTSHKNYQVALREVVFQSFYEDKLKNTAQSKLLTSITNNSLEERYAFAMPHKDLFEFLSDPSDILNTT